MMTDDELMEVLRANVGKPITFAMREVEAEATRRASTVGPTCGESAALDADLVGCGKVIDKQPDVYRCTHCGVPFHRDCAERHFATDTPEHGAKVIDEQLRRLDARSAASSTAASGVPVPAEVWALWKEIEECAGHGLTVEQCERFESMLRALGVRASAPPGYKLVPLEPRPDCCDHGKTENCCAGGGCAHDEELSRAAAGVNAVDVPSLVATALEQAATGPCEGVCAMCNGRGFYGSPGKRCEFCDGKGKVQWRSRPADEAGVPVSPPSVPDQS